MGCWCPQDQPAWPPVKLPGLWVRVWSPGKGVLGSQGPDWPSCKAARDGIPKSCLAYGKAKVFFQNSRLEYGAQGRGYSLQMCVSIVSGRNSSSYYLIDNELKNRISISIFKKKEIMLILALYQRRIGGCNGYKSKLHVCMVHCVKDYWGHSLIS